MTTIAPPADPRPDFRTAVMELSALVALIERPPLDDVVLAQDVALRTAAAIRTVISVSVCSFIVTGDIPEFAADDISHLEGLASYLDGVARDKARAGLPHSKALFAEIAKRLREYDVIRTTAKASVAPPRFFTIVPPSDRSPEAIARAAADGCDDQYPEGRRARDGEKWWCAYDGAMRALALQTSFAKAEARA